MTQALGGLTPPGFMSRPGPADLDTRPPDLDRVNLNPSAAARSRFNPCLQPGTWTAGRKPGAGGGDQYSALIPYSIMKGGDSMNTYEYEETINDLVDTLESVVQLWRDAAHCSDSQYGRVSELIVNVKGQCRKPAPKPIIKEIWIETETDYDPDLSWLGDFSDQPREGAIDHRERQGLGERYLQYFNPANPEYAEEDYARMIAYDRCDWCMLGVTACAKVIAERNGFKRITIFRSCGCWGVESDGKEHIEEVAEEELKDLKEHLKTFNIDLSNFAELAESSEIKEK